jgi:transcriptional regulator with XRE-family HTH domain
MSIGERVHELLKQQGKKQNELAGAIGAGLSTVSQWNKPNRNPSSEMILPICEFFGCSVSYLLTGEESSLPVMSDLDAELLKWLHMLNEETQRDFLGTIRIYVKQHPEDLQSVDSVSDVQESQERRVVSSK